MGWSKACKMWKGFQDWSYTEHWCHVHNSLLETFWACPVEEATVFQYSSCISVNPFLSKKTLKRNKVLSCLRRYQGSKGTYTDKLTFFSFYTLHMEWKESTDGGKYQSVAWKRHIWLQLVCFISSKKQKGNTTSVLHVFSVWSYLQTSNTISQYQLLTLGLEQHFIVLSHNSYKNQDIWNHNLITCRCKVGSLQQ